MRSSRLLPFVCAALATLAAPSLARAQCITPPPPGIACAQGFAVERLYTSAPGGGWFVMDDLNIFGGFGGAIETTSGYAQNPLRIPSGSGSLLVVKNQAFFDFGVAATYDRWRIYLNFNAPLLVAGDGGTVGTFQYAAPTGDPTVELGPHSVDLGSNPDTLADARVGVDMRILGEPGGPFRLGAGAQLFIPSGETSEYITDGNYRAMFRALFAGDVGLFSYAGQVGVHVRTLDTAPQPNGPEGSELLFGAAAGLKTPLWQSTQLVVGPEVYGASAFRSLFGSTTTALEGLLSGRIEGTETDGQQLRVKLGAGLGINDSFGTPEWRAVVSIEMFTHGSDRDHDGVSDSKDACPDVRGLRSEDPKKNGCP
jgi:hypothetical protein